MTSAIPVWRERQIAAAQPVTSKNIPFRPEELLGTEVRNPQNEALGSVENLVISPATDKVAYLVIALDRSLGIDDISVPVPLEDFKITQDANLLVLDTTRVVLEAAPRVNPFSADGIDLAESEGGCLLEGAPFKQRRELIRGLISTSHRRVRQSKTDRIQNRSVHGANRNVSLKIVTGPGFGCFPLGAANRLMGDQALREP